MAIKSIEIICASCPKCDQLKNRIIEIIKTMELQNKIKINYEFKHTTNLSEISKFSLNPSQLPAVIVNGNLEFSGQAEAKALRAKLESIHKY